MAAQIDNNAMMVPNAAAANIRVNIPRWLQEHCERLCANVDDFENLNLNIRQLNPRFMAALSKALLENHTIKTLNMVSSFSTSGPNTNLCLIDFCNHVLPHHKSLKILHLSYNRLSDMTHLANALKTSQLEELYLDYNQLQDASAIALAQGLKVNTSLKVLKLNSNRIGDAGGKALGECLSHNSTLQTLSLCRNPSLGWETGKAMALSLRSNCTLRQLDIAEGNLLLTNGLILEHIAKANKAGRYLIHQGEDNVPLGIWPLVLARSSNTSFQPEISYFFLRERPDLIGLL